MAQAKGVLPRGEEDEVYSNPRACGYFIAVRLDPALGRETAEDWLGRVGEAVDALVERLPTRRGQERGDKVAAVAVGLASRFFTADGQSRFDPPLEPPAAFSPDDPHAMPSSSPPLANVTTVDADVFFYVVSVFEARVNEFISALDAMPEVGSIIFDRGYQRIDGTEPFGYKDGVRNLARSERPDVVFVDRDERNLEEPAWTEGGSYMVFLKIQQHPAAFAALADDATRDAVIGRAKDGTRLDLLGHGVNPKDEPSEPLPNLPPSSHVGKAAPRGRHDDTRIFRRGLPYIEPSPDGQPKIGLHFCSFQASLDQFDVVFNDWMLNPHFRADGAGADALLDPALQPSALTTIENAGFFFVPPYTSEGLAAAVFAKPSKPQKPKTGRLVVRKRVVDPNDASRRFERGGFVFQVLDAQGQLAGGQFTSDSTGRAICPAELTVGETYTLQEVSSPVANVRFSPVAFTMEKRRQQLLAVNTVTTPNTPYGG
jgi:Dyp-type peroxidase family